jgi:hypothetical protein
MVDKPALAYELLDLKKEMSDNTIEVQTQMEIQLNKEECLEVGFILKFVKLY